MVLFGIDLVDVEKKVAKNFAVRAVFLENMDMAKARE